MTASAGLTEVKPDDTDEGVLRRLEAALEQAKAEGPDCSFHFDGREGERVESPNLGAKYVEIAL